MILVRVELWSAITHEKRTLALLALANRGDGTLSLRNYDTVTLKGRDEPTLAANLARWFVEREEAAITRKGTVERHPSERVHVWNLVAKALKNMGYGDA